MAKKIHSGEKIIASVQISGGGWGKTGWRYTYYEADNNLKSGYRCVGVARHGVYPNKTNVEAANRYVADAKSKGWIIVEGRPVQGVNAPIVVS